MPAPAGKCRLPSSLDCGCHECHGFKLKGRNEMFQWDYAVAVMLVGALVGVFVHRSTITQAVLVLASFTSTFGLGWGAVTLIELAIGFWIGNGLIKGAFSGGSRSDTHHTTAKVKDGTYKPGPAEQLVLSALNSPTKANLDRFRTGLSTSENPIPIASTNTASSPAASEHALGLVYSETIIRCLQCDHTDSVDYTAFEDLWNRFPTQQTMDYDGRRALNGAAFKCSQCGSKRIKIWKAE